MQFYLQSSIVEKGVSVRQYKASRLDVIVGSIFTDIVAWFIVVACAATLYTHGMRNIDEPSDAAEAMKPLAGRLRLHPLCRRALQCVALRRVHPSALDRLHRLRRLGFESGLDKGFKRSPVLLLALHAAARRSARPSC